jgi:hypothetical protein
MTKVTSVRRHFIKQGSVVLIMFQFIQQMITVFHHDVVAFIDKNKAFVSQSIEIFSLLNAKSNYVQ